MPALKRKATSSPLSDAPEASIDEYQQITKAAFVERYRVEGLGEGGDVYYQPDVSRDLAACSLAEIKS